MQLDGDGDGEGEGETKETGGKKEGGKEKPPTPPVFGA